jgi:hypothetical protein
MYLTIVESEGNPHSEMIFAITGEWTNPVAGVIVSVKVVSTKVTVPVPPAVSTLGGAGSVAGAGSSGLLRRRGGWLLRRRGVRDLPLRVDGIFNNCNNNDNNQPMTICLFLFFLV